MAINLNTNAQPPKPVINHMALHVLDLAKSSAFYRYVIGLDTIPEPFHDGNHQWFDLGGVQLHLIGKATQAIQHAKQIHFCLSVASVDAFIIRLDKFNALYEDLKGEPKSITIRADGVKQIYFKDPDGYWIEINDAAN